MGNTLSDVALDGSLLCLSHGAIFSLCEFAAPARRSHHRVIARLGGRLRQRVP